MHGGGINKDLISDGGGVDEELLCDHIESLVVADLVVC
jgi:hypothetical protein